jgi:hypothetical protein
MRRVSEIQSTGDYSKDCQAGRQAAADLINQIRFNQDPNILNFELQRRGSLLQGCEGRLCYGTRNGIALTGTESAL